MFFKAAAFVFLVVYTITLCLILVYSIAQFHLLIHYLRRKKNRTSQYPSTEDETLPTVTVQLPVYNEPLVIERLIDHIVRLDYPKDKIHIQVLDDSTDETSLLCQQKTNEYAVTGVNIEHIHRTDRQGFKAGALQHGLATAQGELIAIFDADFLPEADFLRKTIPYFKEVKTGVVQARWGHLNEDYSLITRMQALQLNVHFSIEQTGRNSAGYFLQFNGTAGVWRKQTILDAGGWKADTLTEDLDLSYRAQLKGWSIQYCQDIVAPAELPIDIQGLKSQQFRWMKGGAENARLRLSDLLASDISMGQKLHGSIHLLSSSVFLLVLVLAITSLPVAFMYPMTGVDLRIFIPFLLPVLLLAIVYYKANADTSWSSLRWWQRMGKFIVLFPLFLSLSMGMSWHTSRAILEGYRNKKSAFVRTPKFNSIGRIKGSVLRTKRQSENSGIGIEGWLAFCFLVAVVAAILTGHYAFLFYHLLLLFGFGTIFIMSIHQRYFR